MSGHSSGKEFVSKQDGNAERLAAVTAAVGNNGGAEARSMSPGQADSSAFGSVILDLAPQSVLDRAASISAIISGRRALTPHDVACSVACILAYGLDDDDTLACVSSLDENQSRQFLTAVARRIHTDVSRPIVSRGEPMLPSPHMLSHSAEVRATHLRSDLQYMQNELAMGEAQPAAIFAAASAAMTSAVQRFASALPPSAAASCSNPLFISPIASVAYAGTDSGRFPSHDAALASLGGASTPPSVTDMSPLIHSPAKADVASCASLLPSAPPLPITPLATDFGRSHSMEAALAPLGSAYPNLSTRNSTSPPRLASIATLPHPEPPASVADESGMAPLDALIDAALANESTKAGNFAAAHDGESEPVSDRDTLHLALIESATESLMHADPTGSAADAFLKMMTTLLQDEESARHGTVFQSFVEAWLRFVVKISLVPVSVFASGCAALILQAPVEQRTEHFLAAIPERVAQRIALHASAPGRLRASAGRGRGLTAFSGLAAPCTDPACTSCVDALPEPSAAAQSVADNNLSHQRASLSRERDALDRREQELRLLQHQLNFAGHAMYSASSGPAPPAVAPCGSAPLPSVPLAPVGSSTAPATALPAVASALGASAAPPATAPPPPPSVATALGWTTLASPLPPPPLPPTGPSPSPPTPPVHGSTASVVTASLEPAPLFYDGKPADGRNGPTEPLMKYALLCSTTAVDKAALKALPGLHDKLVLLLDAAEGDFDTWLSNRNAAVKLLTQIFIRLRQQSADRTTAMDATRDYFNQAFAAAPKLSELWRRIRKRLGTDPSTAEGNCLTLFHAIDKFCIPARSNAIQMTIAKRAFRVGEESITGYLRELSTLGLGHFTEAEIRSHFLLHLETAMDSAAASNAYDTSQINDVRDKILELEAELPSDLDKLYDALHRTTSFRTVWTSAAGSKKARAFAAEPESSTSLSPAPPSPSSVDGASADKLASTIAALSQSIADLKASSSTASLPPPSPLASAPSAPPASSPSFDPASMMAGIAQMQAAIAAMGQGWDGKGKGKGKGGWTPRVAWNLPAIIATGLIWPADTVLTWDNPRRKGCADGTNDCLFGLDCPFCGRGRTSEMTIAQFKAANDGKGPGLGAGRAPCPSDVALLHRALECGMASRKIERFLTANPEHCDQPAFQPMTAEQLAAFKLAGG